MIRSSYFAWIPACAGMTEKGEDIGIPGAVYPAWDAGREWQGRETFAILGFWGVRKYIKNNVGYLYRFQWLLMKNSPPENANNAMAVCSHCSKTLSPGHAYLHDSKTYCEACCMQIRSSRLRKSHWQYISSVKNEYLMPGKKNS